MLSTAASVSFHAISVCDASFSDAHDIDIIVIIIIILFLFFYCVDIKYHRDLFLLMSLFM